MEAFGQDIVPFPGQLLIEFPQRLLGPLLAAHTPQIQVIGAVVQGILRAVREALPAAGAEPLQAGDRPLAVGAEAGKSVGLPLLTQQQPVGGHPQRPAHLGHIGHIGVGLIPLPLAHRLTGHPQLLSQLFLRQPGLFPGLSDAFTQCHKNPSFICPQHSKSGAV